MITLGRRYAEDTTGIQVLCTKAGEGILMVDEVEMVEQKPKALPSSD